MFQSTARSSAEKMTSHRSVRTLTCWVVMLIVGDRFLRVSSASVSGHDNSASKVVELSPAGGSLNQPADKALPLHPVCLCIVKLAVSRCCYRKAWIMGALRFVGLAILTAVAPIAVLIGSNPAHADTDLGQPCSPEGAKVWGNPGPIECQRKADGQLQWVSIPASAMCVAICDLH
jgi:hypothetical protein